MVFSHVIFLFAFLPCVLLFYYIVPKPLKNPVLLFFSLLFYYWGARNYSYLLILSILINYLSGLLLDRRQTGSRKRFILIMSVSLNLLLLFIFKYLDFFIVNLNQISSLSIPLPNLVLPIGISFYTFQGLSYTIDVYTGKVKANRNPFQIALFISLFPQLVAGPIVKYKEINDQIRERTVHVEDFSYGIQRFVIGLSKKVLLANVLGETADSIFGFVGSQGVDTPSAWLGGICYAMQIYFDFSGYSDMAIGLGRLFGFHFLENFNYPYVSTSITEFWRRWHISLSTWFRDYLYIPLGGNRKGNVYLHLFIVFLTTGLWHGASWNFVLWGLWHGFFMILEKGSLKTKRYQKIPLLLRYSAAMLVVFFGWILFRSPDLPSTWRYIKILFGQLPLEHFNFSFAYFFNPRVCTTLILALVAGVIPASSVYGKMVHSFEHKAPLALLKTFTVFILFVLCVLYVVNGAYNPFIYFRF